MELTIKFDDTDPDANRRAGILFSELGKVFNPEEPKPMRVFGSKDPETVEEALEFRNKRIGVDQRAMLAAKAVLYEYQKIGRGDYFHESHLAGIILPFFK